ncbi:NAD(P)-dependent oxidoreductase [Oculatella sp. LEGE 06141]|uniref:SDR family oxidoreductase n=1 Tax=Oculatella sp. LEGE 06141 TaxID=1828648 RepID=UPI001882F214|nr:NAD(P)-dependent oxidoreductase [Oculatella sp. LEGE 06141]MBE9178880.1 NAD(P)-dependent oxidoreductase [Oculatella sp. LEGE 06141]
MKKLLITGASGFLGWHLCQLARSQWQVYGTCHAHSVDLPDTTLFPVDLTDFNALKALFQTLHPDAVIHAAALSQPNRCEVEPEASYLINVTASCNLAGLCADAQIPCVFTSTEMVFDGLNPPYRETDLVCPVNRYGEQKVAAETGMMERHPMMAICRMPLMFGAVPHAQSFIQPFIQTLQAGRSLNLFVDEIRTPVSGESAAQGILLALEQVRGRIVHLGGRERLSRYQFGCLMVEVLGLPTNLNPCHQADVKMAAPRPPDLSLDSSFAFGLGYQPGLVRDELERLAIALRPD